MTTPHVYGAIVRVMAAMSAAGISKDRKNDSQGYKFRGIDDVYNALSSVLSENKLCMLPNTLERSCEERKNTKGTALFYVTVKVRFDLVSAEDGSKHEVVMYGEAMDSGDKATNKSMSAAYKYAAVQAFCIPTEGDSDADAHTHEVQPAKADRPPRATPEQIAQLNDWLVVDGMAERQINRIKQYIAAAEEERLAQDTAQQFLDSLKAAQANPKD